MEHFTTYDTQPLCRGSCLYLEVAYRIHSFCVNQCVVNFFTFNHLKAVVCLVLKYFGRRFYVIRRVVDFARRLFDRRLSSGRG